MQAGFVMRFSTFFLPLALLLWNPSFVQAQSDLFAGAPPAPWRPFSDNSPWNSNIESAPLQKAGTVREWATLDSDDYIKRLDKFAASSTIAVAKWSQPLYFVDPDMVEKTDVLFSGEDGYIAEFLGSMNPVPIPPGAVADPGDTGHYPPLLSDIIPDRDRTDSHLCVVDIKNMKEYDFWHMAIDPDGNLVATEGAVTDIAGDGLFVADGDRWVHYARGTAVPLLAGLIRKAELESGEIRHALSMSIPDSANRARFYVWPALFTDGRDENEDSIPEGARLRLKWSEQEIEDKFLRGELSRTGKTIATALRKYGAINVDNGGDRHLTFYAQNFSSVTGNHNREEYGALITFDDEDYGIDIEQIRAADFEVIQFEYGRF